MSQYENFAYIYDHLMEEVDYEKWLFFIDGVFKGENINSVCDLGCGTGNITIPLGVKGYDMIGIDLSEDMLMVAREKAIDTDQEILFLNQDMKEFELYGTVDAIIATCDSINYLQTKDIPQFLKWVHNYLNPKGIFIFDLNTEYKFDKVYGNQTFSELGEDFAYVWENQYSSEAKMNEYYISFFLEEEAGLYSRSDEYHCEYVHDYKWLIHELEKLDFNILGLYDNYTSDKIHEKTERMTFVVRKV